MNDLQVKRYEMFIRVSVFGQTHASAFPSSALAGRLFAEVDETIDQLKDYMTAQITSGNRMRQNTSDKTRLRNKLCESLAAMSRTARSIESASGKRDFFELFRVPRTNLNNQILLGTARVSADRAAQFAEEFAKYEMSVGFFEELNNNIELFEKAVSGQNFGKNAKVEATAAIDQAIKRGRTAVRQLDAIMRNKFGKDTSVMAVWKNASHTVRVSRTAAAKETPETAETPTDANADKQLNHEVHEEHEVREE